jgi:hypothetical protein
MTSRQLTLFALACFVLAIPLSHSAISKKKAKKKNGPAPKVALCHFPDDSDVGHVINVSANAVPAHIEKHGDCIHFLARDNGACRCLTCTERCRLVRARCEEACGDDPNCIARCNAFARECVILCEQPTDPR